MKDTMQKKESSTIRLQVMLSHSGVCSRRMAASLIEEGHVKVNRKVVLIAGHRVDPSHDIVTFDGIRIEMKKEEVFFLMNKPRKVESTNVTQVTDPTKAPRRTVKDIMSRYYDEHIFSVGRLDYHSSGLLIFTTDGELCNRITHPRYEIEKVYVLHTENEFPEKTLEQWQAGIVVKGVRYTLVRYVLETPTKITLVLKEGKNREIRRICEQCNIFIKRLHRVKIGFLSTDNLKVGKVRPLTKLEIRKLYTMVKLEIPSYLDLAHKKRNNNK